MPEKLKLPVTINTILFGVLLYPVILFFPNIFGVHAFFLTTPYFFLIFVCLILLIIQKGKISYFKNLKLLLALSILVIFNFSTIRYSAPLFFVFYMLVLHIVINAIPVKQINKNLFKYFYYVYTLFSFPFVFLNNGWDDMGRFLGFVGSPTVYAGVITIAYALVSKNWKVKSRKFVLHSTIVFFLVFLSKTRLLIIFLLVFPVLKYIVDGDFWLNKKLVFLIFLISVMSVYPLYGVVTDLFPSLVTIRYDEGTRDSSFGLRLHLSNIMLEDYSSGNFSKKVFGKGNEYSRKFIDNIYGFDLMPHNDFLRLLNDWGAIGLFLFLWYLYRISNVNINVFYICLIYLLLFYSNMVFNTYIMSLLIILFHDVKKVDV